MSKPNVQVDVTDLFEDSQPDQTPEPEPTPDEAGDIPEHLQGKSVAELARMVVDSEKFRGAQSHEIGELRRSVDAMLQAQLQQPAPAPAPESKEEQVDFFDDPDKAVDAKIANHPELKAAREEISRLTKIASKSQLVEAHPDMDTIVADPEFGAWVNQSPVRQTLLKQAHFDYDFNAANELFSTWKERKELASREQQVAEGERKAARKAADTGSNNAASAGVARKKYRRSDIMRLRIEDPDRYHAMSQEILRAYRDGDVING